MKIHRKKLIPFLALILILTAVFSLTFYYQALKLDKVKAGEDLVHEIEVLSQEIASNLKNLILTKEDDYGIVVAYQSLEIFENISKLEDKFPLYSKGLREQYLDYFTSLVGVQSLFSENRIEEGTERLKQIAENEMKMSAFMDNLKAEFQADYKQTSLLIRSFIILIVFIALGFVSIRIVQLYKHSMIDPLTELGNRRVVNQLLKDYEKKQLAFSVIMLDIDYFKKVNDTYGHAVGDLVLKFLAEKMKENTRPHDVCARIGGEEFTIFLPSTDLENAYKVAERLREKVEKTISPSGEAITISLGIATHPTLGMTTKEIVDQADQAMYSAKRNGRNQVVTYKEISNSVCV